MSFPFNTSNLMQFEHCRPHGFYWLPPWSCTVISSAFTTLRRPVLSVLHRIVSCWGQIFHATRLYFIGNSSHVNTIMDFGKISSKAQKSPYLHKEASKPIVQAHSISSHFLAHDPNSWVSSGEFWELRFGGPRSMFSKTPVVQSWLRKACCLACLP